MQDATSEFFERLRARGHEPMLRQGHGTLRFEIGDGRRERWYVTVDGGDVSVSHRNAKADCTVRASRELFDGMASGEVNATAALLRGAIGAEGDPSLLMLFQRLFPGPPRAGEDGA
jgi:putative sterol carrier protein